MGNNQKQAEKSVLQAYACDKKHGKEQSRNQPNPQSRNQPNPQSRNQPNPQSNKPSEVQRVKPGTVQGRSTGICKKGRGASSSLGIELGTSDVCLLASKRIDELEKALTILKPKCRKSVEGKLRIQRKGKTFQYYLRTNPKDSEGTYIRKSDMSLAEEVAKNDYYSNLVEEMENEISILNKTVDMCSDERILSIYNRMNPGKQLLLDPIMMNDVEYAERWKLEEYEKMNFLPEDDSDYYTEKGERMRSKSELLIANALIRRNIPYRYEYPLRLEGLGMVHPDFYCLNIRNRKEIVWEHLGMMSDCDYANKNVRKMEKYVLNGFYPGDNMIITMETDVCSINTRIIDLLIDKYLV